MSQTQNIIECAICMDDINFNSNNFIKTECGHCFHASCLMTNVSHNGFGCPYCRTAMAEEVEEDESEWSEVSYDDELYGDDALRGLRFFTDNIEGVEHDAEDVEEEDAVEDEEVEEEEEEEPRPTPEFITQKLIQQGVTMEQLVKALLIADHPEYDNEAEEFTQTTNELFGKLRIIITNYQPPAPAPLVTPVSVVEPVTTVAQVDDSAQPKIHPNVTVRRPMTHI
jgi:hypothetical protein